MPMNATTRLEQLSIESPARIAPAANYVPGVRRGDLLFVSGQTPRIDGAMVVTGKVGRDADIEDARRAARICATRLLAVARDVLGSLNAVESVVELTVYVQSTEEFSEPSVAADSADVGRVRLCRAPRPNRRVRDAASGQRSGGDLCGVFCTNPDRIGAGPIL
jgi:enamine deaminase RidA (YjgF/YER057c/UK114 family)